MVSYSSIDTVNMIIIPQCDYPTGWGVENQQEVDQTWIKYETGELQLQDTRGELTIPVSKGESIYIIGCTCEEGGHCQLNVFSNDMSNKSIARVPSYASVSSVSSDASV